MSSLSNVSLREELQQMSFLGFGRGIWGVLTSNTKQPFSKYFADLYEKKCWYL